MYSMRELSIIISKIKSFLRKTMCTRKQNKPLRLDSIENSPIQQKPKFLLRVSLLDSIEPIR